MLLQDICKRRTLELVIRVVAALKEETPVEKNVNEIIAAIKNHQYLEFQYEGHFRKVVPFAYGGQVTTHNKVMRALQVAGSSSSGKFDFPKLFDVNKISSLRVLEEAFSGIPVGYEKGDKHINPIECEL